MRLHLTGGSGPQVISQDKPIKIRSILIDRDNDDDVALNIVDSGGDVTPVGGFQWSFIGLDEPCYPTVTATLTAPDTVTAVIYYDEGRIVYD